MTVLRRRPLPVRAATGYLVVAQAVVSITAAELRARSRRRGVERLVFWAGRTVGMDTIVLSCVVPETLNAPGRVAADEASVGSAAAAARGHRLGIVAQVHTHPGSDTRHSDGDDDMVLMPFEGMFSLVLGSYGHDSWIPGAGLGIHQFQSGTWNAMPADPTPLIIVPERLDARRGN